MYKNNELMRIMIVVMTRLKNKLLNLCRRYESTKAFTVEEAWLIFKLTAIGEAIGWATLISGLLISHFHLPGQHIAIPIAGQIHGSLFLIYFITFFFIYPSLNWNRTTFLFALISGVLPFGTLILELYKNNEYKYYKLGSKSISLLVINNDSAFVVIPHRGENWQLPGMRMRIAETRDSASKRLAESILGTSNKARLTFYKQFGLTLNTDCSSNLLS